MKYTEALRAALKERAQDGVGLMLYGMAAQCDSYLEELHDEATSAAKHYAAYADQVKAGSIGNSPTGYRFESKIDKAQTALAHKSEDIRATIATVYGHDVMQAYVEALAK